MKSDQQNAAALRQAWERAVKANDAAAQAKALAGLEACEPKDPRWPHRRGDALCRAKLPREAEGAYARAMTLYVEQGFLPRAIAVAKRVVELNPARKDLLLSLDNAPTRQVAAAKNIPIIPWTEAKGIAGARPLERAADASEGEIRFEDANEDGSIEITIADLEEEEAAPHNSMEPPPDASADHVLAMSATKLFAGVPREVLTALARAAELVELERGAVLFSRGDPADALYVVVEGSARLDIPGVGSINLGEAQAFGEACMLDGGVRAGEVRARSKLSLLRIPRSALAEIVRTHPPLENVLFDLLLHRLVGDMLVTSPLFAPFDVPTRLELARFFEVRRVAQGTALAEFGRRSDGLYVVLAGEIHVEDAAGSRRMPPGSIFGKETLASSGAPSRRSVKVVRGEGVVLRLPAARFEALAARFPDALAHIAKLTSSLADVRLEPSGKVEPMRPTTIPPEPRDGSARAAPHETTRAAVPVPSVPAPEAFSLPSDHHVDAGELARGGMGVIHRVISRAILREEAMKLISPSFASTPGAYARFLEEAQIHGQLEHPNILPVHELAIDGEGMPVYFTMQLAHGKTLRKLFEEYPVAERFGAPLERFLRVLVDVCQAVSYAHSRGVIHCDIKPDNIMVASHGRTYLLDWGCAKLKKGERPSGAGGSKTASSASNDESNVFGTFAYMAPEQANGEADKIDERTDVFALGGLLYKFLTNRAPFFASHDDESMALARKGVVKPPGEVFPDAGLPAELCRIALRALAKHQFDRYQTADAFREDIERSIRWGVWFAARTFPKGSVVVKEGDPADAAYIVKSGTAEAFKTVNGKREVLRHIGADEAIGEAALLSDAQRTATVVALEDLQVVVITRETLERELARDSWVGAMVRSLASRFRDRDAGLSKERAK